MIHIQRNIKTLRQTFHWFYQILWRYPLSHVSAHFYIYYLVREAVIWVLINVPSGAPVSRKPASILYFMFHLLIWGWGPWCRSERCRIRGLEAKCFPHNRLPSAVYCSVAGQGENLCCRGFMNIGCGLCLPACLSLPSSLLDCMLTEVSAGCLAVVRSPLRNAWPHPLQWGKSWDSLLHMEMSSGEKGGERWRVGWETAHHEAQREKWVVVNKIGEGEC